MTHDSQCPNCGNSILPAARKCKHCREWIEAPDVVPNSAASTLETRAPLSPQSPPVPPAGAVALRRRFGWLSAMGGALGIVYILLRVVGLYPSGLRQGGVLERNDAWMEFDSVTTPPVRQVPMRVVGVELRHALTVDLYTHITTLSHPVLRLTGGGQVEIPLTSVLVIEAPVLVGDSLVLGVAVDSAVSSARLFAVRFVAGSVVTESSALPADMDGLLGAWAISPDGRHLAYTRYEGDNVFGVVRTLNRNALVRATASFRAGATDFPRHLAHWHDVETVEFTFDPIEDDGRYGARSETIKLVDIAAGGGSAPPVDWPEGAGRRDSQVQAFANAQETPQRLVATAPSVSAGQSGPPARVSQQVRSQVDEWFRLLALAQEWYFNKQGEYSPNLERLTVFTRPWFMSITILNADTNSWSARIEVDGLNCDVRHSVSAGSTSECR